MILLELSAIVAVVLIFAAMMGVLLIELAKAWQLHRERTRRPINPSSTMEHCPNEHPDIDPYRWFRWPATLLDGGRRRTV